MSTLLSFEGHLQRHSLCLQRIEPRVLQINLGKRCNQTCMHCHVNAGPARTEAMDDATVERVLDWLASSCIATVDITGGAPELHPGFREIVTRARSLSQPRRVMDRCNLTILFEPGQEGLAEFLAAHQVEVVASLPCYSVENVERQRGVGVFDKSIAGLQLLNSLGYGRANHLPLNLVYNPVGAFMPPAQHELEAAYREQLAQHFGIVFNHLYALTNMPIARFATYLRQSGQELQYQELLVNAFNPQAVEGLMCRDTINVDWQGRVFDCDFNQMLGLHWRESPGTYLWDLDPVAPYENGAPVVTRDHCFGCTAGAGSSCGGATTVA